MKRLIIGCLFILWANNAQSVLEHYKNGASKEEQAIINLVDGLHYAASKADLGEYLGSFTQNGVFMGTDDWERWSRPVSLDEYVKERFKEGQGWTYKSVERHIAIADNNELAWFDEITVSDKWGRFRGTGVVVKEQGEWKIAHYSMSVLIANEAFFDVADINKKRLRPEMTRDNN